ncbi:hypothetical protein ACSBPQ_07930 [Stenotrophomonas sp. JC08]|uniref:hypothetical protein n=1 Tax=Stenotrophomonas sp. JC08 TaxID=3445779 RepID=UPI003FA25BE5
MQYREQIAMNQTSVTEGQMGCPAAPVSGADQALKHIIIPLLLQPHFCPVLIRQSSQCGRLAGCPNCTDFALSPAPVPAAG